MQGSSSNRILLKRCLSACRYAACQRRTPSNEFRCCHAHRQRFSLPETDRTQDGDVVAQTEDVESAVADAGDEEEEEAEEELVAALPTKARTSTAGTAGTASASSGSTTDALAGSSGSIQPGTAARGSGATGGSQTTTAAGTAAGRAAAGTSLPGTAADTAAAGGVKAVMQSKSAHCSERVTWCWYITLLLKLRQATSTMPRQHPV